MMGGDGGTPTDRLQGREIAAEAFLGWWKQVCMKASEYGGSDTHKTQGIQPSPHNAGDVAHEGLRLLYGTDPAEPLSGPDQTGPRSKFGHGDTGQ